jgi:hypothetical protein
MSLPVFRVGPVECGVHEFLSNSSKDELIAFLIEAKARAEALAVKCQRLEEENNELKEENEELIVANHSQGCQLKALDPDGDMVDNITREHVDDYTQDPEIANILYQEFLVDEESDFE